MKVLFGFLIAGSMALTPAAMADELDFYVFKTRHSKSANKSANFEVEVLKTNRSTFRVNQKSDFDCTV